MPATVGNVALSLVAGGLTTLSPCVFPVLPLVIGGTAQGHRLAPAVMGLGMASSFAIVGVLVGTLGDVLGLDATRIRLFGAVLLVLFGLVMLLPGLNARFATLATPIATLAHRAAGGIRGGSLVGAWAVGSLLGLVWAPCSGPLLGAAITLVATEGGAVRGAVTLGLFGLGAAIPLVGVAYASRAGFSRVRSLVLAHADRMRFVFGLVLVALGIAILTGADKWLETWVVDVLPEAWLGLTTRY